MNILDHGQWVDYTPDPIPADAPSGAIFAQRVSDGMDWYDFVTANAGTSPGTVKFTAHWSALQNHWIVSVATYDGTLLFPAGQLVQEITDYAGSDPQADFGGKMYDPNTFTFTDPPQPPWPAPAKSLEDRIAALEAKLGGA